MITAYVPVASPRELAARALAHEQKTLPASGPAGVSVHLVSLDEGHGMVRLVDESGATMGLFVNDEMARGTANFLR